VRPMSGSAAAVFFTTGGFLLLDGAAGHQYWPDSSAKKPGPHLGSIKSASAFGDPYIPI
jgi:hypothetical protein